ncbi:S41 family peptidase [Flavobacterium sp.]|uniref:S41 family peptidase n=1 Tax=Flavobacterium sp. TaxID=239 RepID=UPI002ED96F2C
MKKIVLIAFVLFFQYSFSKPITETQKLAAVCKVWGFLKYYHPNVADGSKNWDDQLFQILSQIEETKTAEEFSTVVEKWIVSFGEIKSYKSIKSSKTVEYFDKNFDLSWISNSEIFSKSLSKKLKFIEKNRIQGKQFYIVFTEDDTKGVFEEISNEINYPDFKWTDKNLRLLALFRYWNYIEYFFPYKYQMDQHWDKTLENLLPKFSDAKSELDFHLAMKEIIVNLNDSHAFFNTRVTFLNFGDKFIPFEAKIIDDKAVVIRSKNDSLTKIDDIKIGDVITKVDGRTIAEILNEKTKYIEGSNTPTVLRNSNIAVFNGNSKNAEIEFVRDEKTTVKSINRYLYKDLKLKPKVEKEKWKILEGNIGYVDFTSLMYDDVPVLIENLKDTKAVIFDNRCYPNGVMSPIAEWINSKEKDFARFTYPDVTYPGKFVWSKNFSIGSENPNHYKGKVIVLVDENTQSHAEFTAMSIQTAPDVTIIGSQTAGADGNVCSFQIVKGFYTAFSGIGVFYPNKKETQRIGIVPDIEVKPTILGIQQGRDEILERAILFVKDGK